MHFALASMALIAAVAARIYVGRLAARTFDSLSEVERRRINSAIAAGSY